MHDAASFTSPAVSSVRGDMLDCLRPSGWHFESFLDVHATRNYAGKIIQLVAKCPCVTVMDQNALAERHTGWKNVLSMSRGESALWERCKLQLCTAALSPRDGSKSSTRSDGRFQQRPTWLACATFPGCCGGESGRFISAHTTATLFVYVTVELFHSHFTGALLTVSRACFCQSWADSFCCHGLPTVVCWQKKYDETVLQWHTWNVSVFR